ncbi:MAG TPA: hypothetical protein DCE78_06895 [Bacteroidetes bacterium]|nr:hypothetical protein [Bacteroidota bacterium]
MSFYKIEPFWDDEYKHLEYINEPFNDSESVKKWLAMGFQNKICGDMCDMRSRQPSWNNKIIEYFESKGWADVGTSYYRMSPGTVMPLHSDLYRAYVKKFGLEDKKHTIRRALVLLEDWQPGHYLDCMGQAFVHWKAGDIVEWAYDTPHTAANIGMTNRYTLQVTGHLE